jgi:hypothetical protein
MAIAASVWAFAFNGPAQNNGIMSFTNRQGTVYTKVRVIKVSEAGLVYMPVEGLGGGTVKLADLPDDFVRSLGFDPNKVRTHLRENAVQAANRDLEQAIAAGLFREVDGTVYDLRQPQPGWKMLYNNKLMQRLDDGSALLTPHADAPTGTDTIHIKHLADVSDTQLFNLRAKACGIFTYIITYSDNRPEQQRNIPDYDVGRVCSREEIPDAVLQGREASAGIAISAGKLRDIVPGRTINELFATGSGFFVTDDGYIVTNDHVVKGARKLQIRTGDRTLDARVITTSHAHDLAVLKAEGTFKALSLDYDQKVGLGDEVFTIGFPNVDVQGTAPKYTDGKVSSLFGMADDPSQYQISVPVQPGNSGGALVAENGGVVGVVRAKMDDLESIARSGAVPQNVNYAVKVKYLRDLLATIPGVAGNLKPPGENAKASDRVKIAQDAAVIVLVYR